MKTILTCPLGHTCEKVVDDHIERCMWFTDVDGTNASGEVIKETKCAIAWQPILLLEIATTNRGQTHALESMRNETVNRQDKALEVLRDVRKITAS